MCTYSMAYPLCAVPQNVNSAAEEANTNKEIWMNFIHVTTMYKIKYSQ